MGSLKTYSVAYKKVSVIPEDIPSDTEVLTINSCGLEEVHWLPPNLKVLNLGSNILRRITCALPPTLHTLAVNSTRLEELPALPESLRILNITDTHIQHLPPLPQNLHTLYAAGTRIERVHKLPKALQYLSLAYTPLKELPAALPPDLLQLCIHHTPLKTLPPLPSKLRILYCENSGLESVPAGFEELIPPLSWRHSPYRFVALDRCEALPKRNQAEEYEAWLQRLVLLRSKVRMAPLKEELMAAAWAPPRVERWLEAGVELDAF